MKRPEVVDRDTKRDNFCGKTFDGWLSSLSKEEYQYLCNHIVINGDAEKGQSFTLYSYEGLPIGRGKGEGLKATEALRGFDLKLSIASDLQLDFLCGPLFEELKGQQGWPDDIFDFEDSFGYTWYLRRDEMEDKKE